MILMVQLEEDSPRALGMMAAGSAAVLIGLSLPLFHAEFHPPHGSQILYGRRFTSFDLQISGWDFARHAPYARILFLITALLVVLGVRILLFMLQGRPIPGLKPATAVAKAVHAMTASIVALGWLALYALLALLALLHTPFLTVSMPRDGARGILTSLEQPFAEHGGPTVDTPYLEMHVGWGMLFLVGGIIVCLLSLWEVAGAAAIAYVVVTLVVTIVHHVFHQPAVDSVAEWLGSHILGFS